MVVCRESAAEPLANDGRGRIHIMSVDGLPNEAIIGHLRDLLLRHGLRPMVVFLNGLSAFRFSAVTRFNGGMLQTVCYYDREDPRPDTLPEVPESASYCQYAKARRDAFLVPDATQEPCLQTHPARDAMRAYCGAPVYDAAGEVVGSICHFNIEPMPVAERDGELLKAAADLLTWHGALSRPAR